MFQPGDIIVYGNTGVCKVVELSRPNLPGVDQKKDYYLLFPLFQDEKIYSPVDNTKVFMRPVISRKQAEELLYGELAVALEITPKEVPSYIAKRMRKIEE